MRRSIDNVSIKVSDISQESRIDRACGYGVLIGLALALALAGCAATGTPSPAVSQGAISLCNAAGNALKVIAVAVQQHKLTATQIAEVRDAETLTDPVCQSPTPPTDAVAAARGFATGLAALVSLQMQVKKP